MALDERKLNNARKAGFGLGLLKGMGVTLKHLFKHNTVIQYPDEKQDLPARTRGVIALKEENCTVCMLCARECPDWCIYIDSHKEQLPPKREGGRQRKRNVLDRFAIDYALCMYCGICVEVCPYDALFWSREFEYAEYDIRELTHEKERLSDWMASVLPPPDLELGAELPGQPVAAATATGTAPAATTTPPASPATPSTQTSSAAETRPEQAADAPKAPSAAPTGAKEEAPEEKAPVATTATQVDEVPREKAESEGAERPASASESPAAASEAASQRPATPEPAAAPTTPAAETAPAATPSTPSRVPTEDPEAAYERVLTEQRQRGSSAQVAEARAKVARVKAQRATPSGPTPMTTEKLVPSAPTRGEPSEPVPGGAPEAEEPQPEQGPVAASPAEPATAPESEAPTTAPEQARSPAPVPGESAAPGVGEDPEAAYERVLAAERAKGSSDAVATARAKAARMRARKGTKGPGG